MDEHENFEDRLRAMADEISRSLQRMSEVDLDDLAERYGLDVDRARTFADAAGKWIVPVAPSASPVLCARIRVRYPPELEQDCRAGRESA